MGWCSFISYIVEKFQLPYEKIYLCAKKMQEDLQIEFQERCCIPYRILCYEIEKIYKNIRISYIILKICFPLRN